MRGLPKEFATFVLQSLQGTTLAMKTNVPGRTTAPVELNKAIKQGCPLAPLLFVFIMDELHRDLREVGGYTLGTGGGRGKKVSSRGYCDDTTILADTPEALARMNATVSRFFQKHKLNVNLVKTKVTGRNRDGTDFTTQMKWPGTGSDMMLVPTSGGITYLGVTLSLDMSWVAQKKAMNKIVMSAVQAIRSSRLTLYQSALIVREVIGPKIELKLRHAAIPMSDIAKWDKWLGTALLKRAGLGGANIHHTAARTLLNIPSLLNLNTSAKTLQVMETLTQHTELRAHYRHVYEQHILDLQEKADEHMDSPQHKAFKPVKREPVHKAVVRALYAEGIQIRRNTAGHDSDYREKVTAQGHEAKDAHTYTFNGHKINIRDTHTLWGEALTHPADAMVVVCTDGSTYAQRPSGAAVVYCDDLLKRQELWPNSIYFRISQSDNYAAELAAINRALRSVPVTMAIRIHTDSLSSKQAIANHMKRPKGSAPLGLAGRPYIMAIGRALQARDKAGSLTQILHVHSHTGRRDIPSIGNGAADRCAKYAALAQEPVDSDIDIMANELQYVVYTHALKGDKPVEGTVNPIHGSIRQALRRRHAQQAIRTWAMRPKYGKIARMHETAVTVMVKEMWKQTDSTTLKFMLEALNDITDKTVDDAGQWAPKKCERCGDNADATFSHRVADCPAVASIWNALDRKIWALLTTKEDAVADNGAPTPTRGPSAKYIQKFRDALGHLYKRYSSFADFPAEVKTKVLYHAGKCRITNYADPSGWGPDEDGGKEDDLAPLDFEGSVEKEMRQKPPTPITKSTHTVQLGSVFFHPSKYAFVASATRMELTTTDKCNINRMHIRAARTQTQPDKDTCTGPGKGNLRGTLPQARNPRVHPRSQSQNDQIPPQDADWSSYSTGQTIAIIQQTTDGQEKLHLGEVTQVKPRSLVFHYMDKVTQNRPLGNWEMAHQPGGAKWMDTVSNIRSIIGVVQWDASHPSSSTATTWRMKNTEWERLHAKFVAVRDNALWAQSSTKAKPSKKTKPTDPRAGPAPRPKRARTRRDNARRNDNEQTDQSTDTHDTCACGKPMPTNCDKNGLTWKCDTCNPRAQREEPSPPPSLQFDLEEIVHRTQGATRLFYPAIQKVALKHFKTRKQLMGHPLQMNTQSLWHSTYPQDALLGANTGPADAYMQNSCTWADLVGHPRHREAIRKALQAAGDSTTHTNIVMMLEHSHVPESPQHAGRIRIHTLAIIPKDSRPAYTISKRDRHKRAHNKDVAMILVTNNRNAGYDTTAIRKELTQAIATPTAQVEVTLRGNTHKTTECHERREQHFTPTLSWHRYTPPTHNKPTGQWSEEEAMRHMETHDTCAAMAGISPEKLMTHLLKVGHKRHVITKQKVHQIAKWIHEAALTAYQEVEDHRRTLKRGDG